MNSRLFQRLLLSYFLISLIPIALGLVAYRNTLNVVESKTYENTMQLLDQCIGMMDQRFRDLERSVTQLSMNEALLAPMRCDPPEYDPTATSRMLEARDQLFQMTLNHDGLLDLYVYYNKPGIIISSQRCFISVSRFYGDFFLYAETDVETWVNEMLEASYRARYFPAADIMIRQSATTDDVIIERAIVHARAIPLLGRQQGKILALLPTRSLESIAEKFDMEGGWLSITDAGGQILFLSNNQTVTSAIRGAGAGLMGTCDVREVDGQDMLVVSAVSSANGWRYTATIPHSQLQKELTPLSWMVTVLLALEIITVGAAAFFAARRNLRPLNNLVAYITKNSPNPIPSNARIDEYAYLDQQVRRLMNNNSELRNRVNEQLPVIRNSVVSAWLLGEYHSRDALSKALSRIGRAPVTPIALLLIEYDTLALLEDDTRFDVAKSIVSQHMAKYSLTWHCDCNLSSNRQVQLFLPCETDYHAEAEKLADELIRMVAMQCGIEIRIATGMPVSAPELMPKLYESAVSALARWDGALLRWPVSEDEASPQMHYPIRTEEKLSGAIRQARREEAISLLDEVYEQNFLRHILPSVLEEALVQALRVTYLRLLQEMRETLPGFDAHQEGVLALGLKTLSPKGIFGQLTHLTYVLCDHTQALREAQLKNAILPALTYIQDNFQRSQLSLGEVAAYMHMSEAHFSRLFKEHVGSTYSDYLEQLRISNACAALERGMTVDEVATLTGYNSAYVFRNAFKRVMGYTPSTHRSRTRTLV